MDKALHEGLARFENVTALFGHEVVDVEETADAVTAIVWSPGRTAPPRKPASPAATWSGARAASPRPASAWACPSRANRPPPAGWWWTSNNDPLGTPNVFLGADPKRPYVSIGLPHAVRRWEFMLRDDESDELATDPDVGYNAMLKEHVPNPENLDFIRRRVFTHHARVAGYLPQGPPADRRRRRPPDARVDGPGLELRHARRHQPGVEAGLGALRAGRRRPAGHLHGRAHRARQVDGGPVPDPGQGHQDHQPGAGRRPRHRASVLNLFPSVKSYFADMRFKPMPRYTKGVLADPNTQASGTALGKLTSKLIPVATANTKVSPVGVQFPQPRVNSKDATERAPRRRHRQLVDRAGLGQQPQGRAPRQALARLAALGARLVAVVPETQRAWAEEHTGQDVLVLGDHTGRLKKWFDDRPTPMVFLRPDRFVAGACLAQNAPRPHSPSPPQCLPREKPRCRSPCLPVAFPADGVTIRRKSRTRGRGPRGGAQVRRGLRPRACRDLRAGPLQRLLL